MMSPAEIKLTGKMTAIVAIISLIVNLTVAFTTVRIYTASLMSSVADHESRIRNLESCFNTDINIIKADVRWIVSTLDRMEGRP